MYRTPERTDTGQADSYLRLPISLTKICNNEETC